jgi:hypothetical protein
VSEQVTSKDRVSDYYLESTLRSISQAAALDSQLISTSFLRMLCNELIERRASNEPLPIPLVLAAHFHEAYERLSANFGYETRPETRVFDPESPNGKLMIAVCTEILRASQPPSAAPVCWSLVDEYLQSHTLNNNERVILRQFAGWVDTGRPAPTKESEHPSTWMPTCPICKKSDCRLTYEECHRATAGERQ